MATRPHFAFPFKRSNGKLAVVEQDTDAHVINQEMVIIYCPVGFRVDRPEFGWPMPDLVTAPLNLDALENALTTFGPRETLDITEYADDAAAGARHVRVEIQTDTERNG